MSHYKLELPPPPRHNRSQKKAQGALFLCIPLSNYRVILFLTPATAGYRLYSTRHTQRGSYLSSPKNCFFQIYFGDKSDHTQNQQEAGSNEMNVKAWAKTKTAAFSGLLYNKENSFPVLIVRTKYGLRILQSPHRKTEPFLKQKRHLWGAPLLYRLYKKNSSLLRPPDTRCPSGFGCKATMITRYLIGYTRVWG